MFLRKLSCFIKTRAVFFKNKYVDVCVLKADTQRC